MYRKFAQKHGTAVAIILFALAMLGIYALSWIITCGVVKLIAMCFGWTFTWPVATGVWLVTCLARSVFNNTITVKK